MDGTVASTGSRPSGRRPTSSQVPSAVSSSAISQPAAAVIPSSTTTTGGRCRASGRATRSSTFSTSSRPSGSDEPCVQAASLRANAWSSRARRALAWSHRLAYTATKARHPAGVGAGEADQGPVGPGPRPEHPRRGLGQRRRGFLGGREPAGQPQGRLSRTDFRRAVPGATVLVYLVQRLRRRCESFADRVGQRRADRVAERAEPCV